MCSLIISCKYVLNSGRVLAVICVAAITKLDEYSLIRDLTMSTHMFCACVAAITNHDEYSLIRELTDRRVLAVICVSAITNHDEYSLIRELTDEEREKTLTLRRRDQKKMDEMKKKLHTDERT